MENERINDLSINDIFRLADLYFYKKNYIYRHLYNSYNKFLEEDVPRFLTAPDNVHVFHETITENKVYKHRFLFNNIIIESPSQNNGVEPLFPIDARQQSLSYSIKMLADVKQELEIIDIATYSKDETGVVKRIIGEEIKQTPIAIIPLMLRSKYCNLNKYRGVDKYECEYDPGGYFIVNGSEKIVISQDKMIENKPLIYSKKDGGVTYHIAQINSKSPEIMGINQIMTIKLKRDSIITAKISIFNEINVFMLMRALGIESDKSIIDYTIYDTNDIYAINIIRPSLDNCKNERDIKVTTQEEAIDYLLLKLRITNKKYSDTNKQIRQEQRRMHLLDLLTHSFLPHVKGGLLEKAYYLGYMINKLVNVELGRIPIDDRDSYLNKTVEQVGDLFFDLFKQQYKKMMNECSKFFDSRNESEENPVNIIHQIKPNIIEQGIKTALLTGTWIRKKGVAQMLQRLTYLQTISFMRRIDSPGGDNASMKLTSPRQIHPSAVGFLCCVTGDTAISMADGSIKLIKDIVEEDSIISVYSETLNEQLTKIHSYFTIKNPKKILEITLLNGNKIKCTTDHPLLIETNNEYNYINAGDVKLGDLVITKHMLNYINDNKNYDVYIKYEDIPDKLKTQMLSTELINKNISQELLKITARLVALCNTDGHIGLRNKNYEVSFFVGEQEDVYDLLIDIQKLGFLQPSISRSITKFKQENRDDCIHKTYRVSQGGGLAYYLHIMGGFIGRKTNQKRFIPDWIKNGNINIKREYLSGFQGGDGKRILIQKNMNTLKLNLGSTMQTTTPEYLDDTIKYMNQIRDLFNEFNIQTNLVIRDSPININKEVLITFSTSIINLYRYVSNITYRYCNEKRRHTSLLIDYIKYRYNQIQLLNQKYNIIIKLYDENYKVNQINEMTKIPVNIIKRIIYNKKNNNSIPNARFDTSNQIKYNEFLNKYHIKNDKFKIPIISINEIESEPVYDFTTYNNAHSFIANGIVTHNCVQTPEHTKVGLTKHLNLVTSLSIMEKNVYDLIYDYITKYPTLVKICNAPINRLRYMYKIFLNGEWLGLIENGVDFYKDMYNKKLKGYFGSKSISVAWDYEKLEMRVRCDSGRMYRPVIRIEENIAKLTKKHLEQISLNKAEQGKITDWNDFMIKYPDVIEYIDIEEQPYLLLSENIQILQNMYKQMEESKRIKIDIKDNYIANRYDNMFFLKYSHLELHPSLLLGEISVNVPFIDRNVGPRNIFEYSQGKQAMGIYTTNYRQRLDISYILYHPQRQLIRTRGSRYVNTRMLPSGENAIVAIACYTG